MLCWLWAAMAGPQSYATLVLHRQSEYRSPGATQLPQEDLTSTAFSQSDIDEMLAILASDKKKPQER